MNRIPVKSSNVKSMGYDPATKILQAEFHSGAIWNYSDVPPDKFAQLLKADADPELSLGSHFHRLIKSQHTATKVEKEAAKA